MSPAHLHLPFPFGYRIGMRPLLRRYRWWLVGIGIVLLIGLGRWAYFTWLPMDGWLTRGWYAMHDGRYPIAEVCFKRAAKRNPRSPLPKVALYALFSMQAGEPEKLDPFGPLMKIPIAREYLQEKRVDRITEGWVRAEDQALELHKWITSNFGIVGVGKVFDTAWLVYPRQTTAITDAVAAACAGKPEDAYTRFAALEARDAKSFAYITGLDGHTLYYYADAAWRTGRRAEATRIISSLTSTPPLEHDDSLFTPSTIYNYRISGPDVGPNASTRRKKSSAHCPAST